MFRPFIYVFIPHLASCYSYSLVSLPRSFLAQTQSVHTVSWKLQSVNDDSDQDEMRMDRSQLEWLEKQSQSPIEPDSDFDEDVAEKIAGGVAIPKTGISVNDEMMKLQNQEDFLTRLFPLEISGVAVIETITARTTSDEPMRYLVPLNNTISNSESDQNMQDELYALIDCPPYSENLVSQMNTHMTKRGKLSMILITCRTNIHYDEAQAVYTSRRSDLVKWKRAFPDVRIVVYRLDAPRDSREVVSQQLDGYGPWALENGIFRETGRPLTVEEWDKETQEKVLDEGDVPPDDEDEVINELYTPEAIRTREENRDVLAIYTPGHTYGSVTYIFPKSKVCCSGFTLPVEDNRYAENNIGAGRKLDFSGYLTTNMGDIDRQAESGRQIILNYADRFDVICPARGPTVNLGTYIIEEKQRNLLDMVSDFQELGRMYNSLGIIN